jgi:TonB family protein
VIEGKYDALFPGGVKKPSDMYRATQNRPLAPSIRLVSSVPVAPNVFALPEYPQLPRLARIEGVVTFKISVDVNGDATDLTFESGPPLLQQAVKNTASKWKFPIDSAGQMVEVTIEFALNCPPK